MPCQEIVLGGLQVAPPLQTHPQLLGALRQDPELSGCFMRLTIKGIRVESSQTESPQKPYNLTSLPMVLACHQNLSRSEFAEVSDREFPWFPQTV